MVHGLRTNNLVNEKFMAIKTDMSKVYDHVEWNFLETLMERIGFDRKWVCWVMACVSIVSYTILLSGWEHGFFRPERGIHQGDPISPFLFIMCAEALLSVLDNAESKGRLHGIQLAVGGPSVHHLLFADDRLLLCQANLMESVEVLRCLNSMAMHLANRLTHLNLRSSLVKELRRVLKLISNAYLQSIKKEVRAPILVSLRSLKARRRIS